MKDKIDLFDGEYLFLSNFYEREIDFKGLRFKSSEAAYQSQKDPSREKEFINLTPMESKRLARKVNLREDWHDVKYQIMEIIVREKFFQNKDLAEKLMATRYSKLIEGNYWKDTYWGVCNGVGENNLGKILMKVRYELQILNTNFKKGE